MSWKTKWDKIQKAEYKLSLYRDNYTIGLDIKHMNYYPKYNVIRYEYKTYELLP